MSKSFWAIIMIFSALITTWAGFFVYNELQPKEPVAVPLTPAPIQPAPVPMAVEPSTTSIAIESTQTGNDNNGITIVDEPLPEEKMASSEKEIKPAQKKTKTKTSGPAQKESVFLQFKQSSAKKVYVVGDFNKWFRQPMKREGDIWKITVKVLPGTYQYVFVVDDGQNGNIGKRIPDPNTPKSKDGKLSILTVKSSAEN